MKDLAQELETYCELHWWNMGKKTLSFKGKLVDLLENQKIKFTKEDTDFSITNGIFTFHFESYYGISFKTTGLISDFPHLAKQAIQMELVRMGDKSQLYVEVIWRPKVTVNF
jgi:hypothetical protein